MEDQVFFTINLPTHANEYKNKTNYSESHKRTKIYFHRYGKNTLKIVYYWNEIQNGIINNRKNAKKDTEKTILKRISASPTNLR